jgi:hypothetical protein
MKSNRQPVAIILFAKAAIVFAKMEE